MDEYSKYIGRVFDNRYTIERMIGLGGMSCVFLASDSVMNRKVAIKLLRDELLNDEDAVGRFINESKAVSMLSHDNIIQCFDVSNSPDLKYIVLEYAEGCTLKDYMQKKGKLPAEVAIGYTIEILNALVHAHSKNVIHRDIKPQNVLLTSDGKVKLSDFGIAQIPTGDLLSVSCHTVGTVDYISPEQAQGGTMDCRSDLYSLGIVLYEMVTGRLPFISDNPMDVAYMQISDTPVAPSETTPDLPKGLEQIILRAIRKNPNERFQTAGQMLDCLLRLRDNPDAVFDFVTFEPVLPDNQPKAGSDLLFSGSYLPESSDDFRPVSLNSPKVLRGSERKRVGRRKVEKKVIHRTVTEIKTAHVSMVAMLCGILCAMCLVGLTALLYVYANYFSSIISAGEGSEVIVVDDLEGQLYNEDLQRKLEAAGYEVTLEWVSDTDRLYSTVVSQSPKKNSRRTVIVGKQHCPLTLYLSDGEGMFSLENYVGLEYREANIDMIDKKLNVSFERIYSDTMPEGRIVSTYPAGGTLISSDTMVTVYVSKGPEIEYTTVPQLVGHNILELADILEGAGLRLGRVEYLASSTVPRGRVISQSLFRGQTVPAGLTKVDIVVSDGDGSPDPTPTLPDPTLPEPTLPDPTLPAPSVPTVPPTGFAEAAGMNKH